MIQKFKLPAIICLIVYIEILLLFLVDIWVIRILILFHMHICIHEISHAIAYAIQKINVYCIMIVPIKITNSKKIAIDFNIDIRYLGMVIPEIDNISEEELLKFKSKFRKAIIAGSITNLVFATIFFILEIAMDNRYISACLLINLFMFIMGVSQNDYVKGDILAFIDIKKDIRFYYLYMYTYVIYKEECCLKDSKFFINLFADAVKWNRHDNVNKKMLYNIFKEQLKVEELCINRDFLEAVILNANILIQGARQRKYVDYAICNELIMVLLRYDYLEEATYIYDSIKNIFPNNSLLIESTKQFQSR